MTPLELVAGALEAVAHSLKSVDAIEFSQLAYARICARLFGRGVLPVRGVDPRELLRLFLQNCHHLRSLQGILHRWLDQQLSASAPVLSCFHDGIGVRAMLMPAVIPQCRLVHFVMCSCLHISIYPFAWGTGTVAVGMKSFCISWRFHRQPYVTWRAGRLAPPDGR